MSTWNWVAVIALAIIALILVFMGPAILAAVTAGAFSASIITAIVVLITAIVVAVIALIKDPDLLSNILELCAKGIQGLGTAVAKVIGEATSSVSKGLMNGFGPVVLLGGGALALFLIMRR